MDKRKLVFWCIVAPAAFFLGLYGAALLERVQ